jgi:hypothetical protein
MPLKAQTKQVAMRVASKAKAKAKAKTKALPIVASKPRRTLPIRAHPLGVDKLPIPDRSNVSIQDYKDYAYSRRVTLLKWHYEEIKHLKRGLPVKRRCICSSGNSGGITNMYHKSTDAEMEAGVNADLVLIDQLNIEKKTVNRRGSLQWKMTRDLQEETDWENEFN